MGKAILIQDVSFAGFNLGTVTPLQNIPVEAIAITGPSSVIGSTNAATFEVAYTPLSTDQRKVVWSISSGSQYATIDQQGRLSVLVGANQASVTIRAVSFYNAEITATKTIEVTRIADNLWDAAQEDSDFAQYMVGKVKLFSNTTDVVRTGSEVGVAITQPITSLTQDYVVLIDATFEPTAIAVEPCPALCARLGDNFAINCLYDASDSTWGVAANWGATQPRVSLGIGGSNATGRYKLLIYYDKVNKKVSIKNLTTGTKNLLASVGDGGGTLRPEAYIYGGTIPSNDFTGTIHEFYIGG